MDKLVIDYINGEDIENIDALENNPQFMLKVIKRSKDKNMYISRCRYCGRILPVENSRGVCRRCHYMRYE